MSTVPANWDAVPLGELVETSRPRVQPSGPNGLPFIGMEHIESETMRLLRTSPASTMKSAGIQFDAGDVLYGRLRPYLNKVHRPDFAGIGSAEFIVMTPSERLDGNYLRYLLNSHEFVRFAAAESAGDRPRVDFKRLAPYVVPLPSVETQREVVAAIESQLSRLDAARHALLRSQVQGSKLRAAILDHAWRKWRSGSAQHSLVDLSDGGDYGTSQKATYEATGPAIVRIPNIVGARLVLSDLKFATKPSELNPKRALSPGDFLVVRTNGSRNLIGRGALVEAPLPSPHYHASYLIRFRLVGDSDLWRWVSLIWSAPALRAALEGLAATSAGQYNVSLRSLARVGVPLPASTQLASAVQELDERLTVVDQTQYEVLRGLSRTASLRRAILKTAFRGGLQ